MKFYNRLLCTVMILAFLCPLLISCSRGLAPSTTAESTTVEATKEPTEEAPLSYPCETDPDFFKTWEEKPSDILSLKDLPVATSNMTAMERRKLCLDYFRLQLTFLWQTNLDVTDYMTTYAGQYDSRALLKENLYSGIPYQSGGNGNLYRITEYYDESTGVLDLLRAFAENGGYGEGADLEEVKKNSAGEITYKRYRSMKTFFNACSSGANWAWGRVINSADFGSTSDYNVNGGFIPVGCYTYTNMQNMERFGDAIDTPNVVVTLGAERLYHCYALMRPADCVVNSGHVMMVAKVNLVRRADGTPDPKRSTVLLMDQTEVWVKTDSLNGKKLYQQGNTKYTLTFEQLKSKNYIPFTFAELLDENDPFDKPHLDFYNDYIAGRNYLAEKYKQTGYTEKDLDDMTGTAVEKGAVFLTGKPATLEELAKCSVGSNYPVSDVFVRVKSADGNTLLENIYRVKGTSTRVISMSSQMSNAETGADGKRPPLLTGVADALAKGGKLEIALQISTGELLFVEGLDF